MRKDMRLEMACFLFSVFWRMMKKAGNTGAEPLRGTTSPLEQSVYPFHRLLEGSLMKSYGEEKPHRYSTNNTCAGCSLCHMGNARFRKHDVNKTEKTLDDMQFKLLQAQVLQVADRTFGIDGGKDRFFMTLFLLGDSSPSLALFVLAS